MEVDEDRNQSGTAAELRCHAEEQLLAKASGAGISRSDCEMQRLLHELQVHRIELEMQNTELRQSRDEVEKSLEKFTDLYDFAPIGYFTLDRNGAITAANLSGASLLGVERSRLIGRSFRHRVTEEYRPVFASFLDAVYTSLGKAVCEVALRKEGSSQLFVQIEAIDKTSEQECRLALIDISERRRMERESAAYQDKLRLMGLEISLIEERERRQLATVLHDQVGQVLALAKIKLGTLKEAASVEEYRQLSDEVRKLLDQAINSSRSLTFEISPPILYDLGFEAAVQALCEKFQQQNDFRLEFATDRKPKSLKADMGILLYRAVRELLVNIVKHARAGSVRVSCQREGKRVLIEVADDGKGFEPTGNVTNLSNNRGFGLFSIRERLYQLGGEMAVDSAPGQGTRITLVAPLQENI
jgi:PAS domain S-box-containing protein